MAVVVMESRKIHRREKLAGSDFEERMTYVDRVAKVTKGGRIFSFAYGVVIGDKNGSVGSGHGKSLDVNGAKRKSIGSAKNSLYKICITRSCTIPHEVFGKSGATKVMLRPAKAGTGIIAGGAMRQICDCLGLKDVVGKIYGSRNAKNVVNATIKALLKLKSIKYFKVMHGENVVKSTKGNVQTEDVLAGIEENEDEVSE